MGRTWSTSELTPPFLGDFVAQQGAGPLRQHYRQGHVDPDTCSHCHLQCFDTQWEHGVRVWCTSGRGRCAEHEGSTYGARSFRLFILLILVHMRLFK